MPAGAKTDPLGGIIKIAQAFENTPFEPGQVDQNLLWRRLAGER
jgi:hypothetical protein